MKIDDLGVPLFLKSTHIVSTFDMLGMIIIHEAMAIYNQ